MEPICLKPDNKELEKVLDSYTKLLSGAITNTKELKSIADLYSFDLLKRLRRVSLAEKLLKISEDKTDFDISERTCRAIYKEVYTKEIPNVIIAVPTAITRLDKEFVATTIRKDVNDITAADIKLMRTIYPSAVTYTMAYQFFIDVNGKFYQAHLEVFNNGSLSEYAISDSPKSEVINLLAAARTEVLS